MSFFRKHFLKINLGFLLFALLVVSMVGFYVQTFDRKLAEASDDTIPPEISDVSMTDLTATSTYVTWKTDELSDSLINFGLSKNYGIARDPHYDKKEHRLLLDELLPNTAYYYRITSTDASGNQRLSNDYTFTTPKDKDYQFGDTLQDYKEVCAKLEGGGDGGQKEEKPENPSDSIQYPAGAATEQEKVQEILEKVSQLTQEKSLEIIKEHIENVAEEITTPLNIILDLATLEIGADYVIVNWKTNKEANSIVSMVADSNFDPEDDSPYTWNEGFPDEYTMDHRVEITGLSPATSYHFQVSSKTKLDQEAKSPDNIFRTKSILPEIYNLAVSKVQEDSATLSWITNIPTSALAEYTNLNSGEAKLEGHSNFVTTHFLQLKNLIFDTYYSVVITVENEQNEKAYSQPVTFITTRDQVPPVIQKVNTESTLYPGSDNKVQTIIGWETDEQAICQLFYHQGIVSIDESQKLPEEQEFAAKHVQVVTNFLPASVYKFWVECQDDAKNRARSADFTMLTPSQEESIIDIILKNFEGTFGWVKKLKM